MSLNYFCTTRLLQRLPRGLDTNLSMRSTIKNKAPTDSQAGMYAVEFALVFATTFSVLYAVLAFGMIFTAQQMLNYAAEEASRSALTYASSPSARMANACKRAQNLTEWIGQMRENSIIEINVCKSEAGALSEDGRQIIVQINYTNYSQAPLVPAFTSSYLPDSLRAQAVVNLNIGGPPASTGSAT